MLIFANLCKGIQCIQCKQVNSSQNLQAQVPKKVDFFLFLTRPTIWVYNRLIVMFLTFYAFYYVFGIGPLCISQCKVDQVKELQSIGVMFFTLPFNNVLYLFEWKEFDLSSENYKTSKQTVFAVIQQVLIFTTILDLLMDIWSVSQIFKKICWNFRSSHNKRIWQKKSSYNASYK